MAAAEARQPDLLGTLTAVAVRADLGEQRHLLSHPGRPVRRRGRGRKLCSELKRRNFGCLLADEASALPDRPPLAVVLGCAGERLTPEESAISSPTPIRSASSCFARNCRTRDQVRALVGGLRDCVGRADAPVLIDQEGGRVARLKPPRWRAYPAAAQIAALPDPFAEEAARLGARLIADDLARLGITVDCVPVLDLPVRGRRPGDRRSRLSAPSRRGWRGSAGPSARACWPAACCR